MLDARARGLTAFRPAGVVAAAAVVRKARGPVETHVLLARARAVLDAREGFGRRKAQPRTEAGEGGGDGIHACLSPRHRPLSFPLPPFPPTHSGLEAQQVWREGFLLQIWTGPIHARATRVFMRGKIGSVRGASAGNVVPAERGRLHSWRGGSPPLAPPSASPVGLEVGRVLRWNPSRRLLSASHKKMAALGGRGGWCRYRHKMEDAGGAGRANKCLPLLSPPPPSSAARARLAPDTKEPLGLCLPPHAWDAPGGGLEALEPLPESSPSCLRDLKRGGAEELEAGLGPSLGLGAPEGRN